MKKVLNAPINKYFDVISTGSVRNRVLHDTGCLRHIHGFLDWVNGMLLEIIKAFTIILITDWEIIYICPVVFMMQVYYLRKTIPAWSDMCKLHRSLDVPCENLLNETLDGLSTIKTFGRVERFKSRYYSLRNQKQLVDMSHCGIW